MAGYSVGSDHTEIRVGDRVTATQPDTDTVVVFNVTAVTNTYVGGDEVAIPVLGITEGAWVVNSIIRGLALPKGVGAVIGNKYTPLFVRLRLDRWVGVNSGTEYNDAQVARAVKIHGHYVISEGTNIP